MKKIFQIIFLKSDNQIFEQELQAPVIYRRLADSPDSTPGERIDLDKRKLTTAPGEFQAAPGRV